MRMQFSNQNLNKSRGSEVERLITFLTTMKKLLFALSMLAFVVSALPQARADDEVSADFFSIIFPVGTGLRLKATAMAGSPTYQ